MRDIKDKGTEDINERTSNISSLNVNDIVSIIHKEDKVAFSAVGRARAQITLVIERCLERMNSGGRVLYVGSGTSGRLGALDAIEMEPTYGMGKNYFDFIVAGGIKALTRSIEGAEDNTRSAVTALSRKRISNNDVVIGISASGKAPFVISAIKHARSLGCYTVAILNNSPSPLEQAAEDCILLKTGPEVIQGSTRMKAGTAQKMTLNIISTTLAVSLGRTDGNYMTHMKSYYNSKLRARALKIISSRFNMGEDQADEILRRNKYDIEKAMEEIEKSMN